MVSLFGQKNSALFCPKNADKSYFTDRTDVQSAKRRLPGMGRPKRSEENDQASHLISLHRIFSLVARKKDQVYRDHMKGARSADATISDTQKED
jgi:hypothetical protein